MGEAALAGEWRPLMLFLGQLGVQLTLAALVLLRRPRHRSSTLAWVLIILAVPVVGLLAYVLVGEVRLGDRRRRAYRTIQERVHATCMEYWAGAGYPVLSDPYRPIATLAEAVAGTVPRSGNAVDLIGDTDVAIDRLIEDIDAAKLHCHLLFYIYLDDSTGRRVAEALERAAKRGVACRLLLDGVGSRGFLQSRTADELREAGVHVVEALPANLFRAVFARLDLRNHRKIAVIDSEIGYTGSQNVADASFAPRKRCAPWVDAMVRVRGPVVRDLQEIFVVDWFLDAEESLEELLAIGPDPEPDGVTMQVMATGPGSVNEAMVQIMLAGIHAAREELILTTPYFVPDEATLTGLVTAARRGVNVLLAIPAHSDSPLVQLASRSYFSELLEAGVEVYEYSKGMLHAKTLTMDRMLALVSTANLDRRSFDLNFEVSTLVFDSDFASQLRMLQKDYLGDSRRLEAGAWRRRGWARRIVENTAGILSPVL